MNYLLAAKMRSYKSVKVNGKTQKLYGAWRKANIKISFEPINYVFFIV